MLEHTITTSRQPREHVDLFEEYSLVVIENIESVDIDTHGESAQYIVQAIEVNVIIDEPALIAYLHVVYLSRAGNPLTLL